MTLQVSRSEKKRQFKQVEQMAQQLAKLGNSDLAALPATDEVKAEIRNCRGLKGGAEKRQIKYLAKVVRQGDLEPLYDFLAARKGSQLKSNQQHHEAERLRDVLINEALESYRNYQLEEIAWDLAWQGAELAAVLGAYPDLNEGELRKAIDGYVRTRNRAQYRELFRMLKAAIEQLEIRERLV